MVSVFIVTTFCCLVLLNWEIASPRHRKAPHIAPLADAVVAEQVDGFVFPERALAGGWRHGFCWFHFCQFPFTPARSRSRAGSTRPLARRPRGGWPVGPARVWQ